MYPPPLGGRPFLSSPSVIPFCPRFREIASPGSLFGLPGNIRSRSTKELRLDFDERESAAESYMEGDTFSGLGNGTQVDNKVIQTFQKSFVQVQNILDQNRLLINEINQNHESKIPDNLSRNVGLIRELNSNIRRVVDLYRELSSSFTKSMEASSEGDSAVKSDGKSSGKRIRSG